MKVELDIVLEGFENYVEGYYKGLYIPDVSEKEMQQRAFKYLKLFWPQICTHFMCDYLGSWNYARVRGDKIHESKWMHEMQEWYPEEE